MQVAAQEDNPSLRVRGGFSKVLIPTKNERRLVGIGPDVLSVHVLRPYPFWEEFYQRIEAAIRAYWVVAEPQGVSGISIRYINRVTIEAPTVDLGDYFTIASAPPPGISLNMSNFLSRTESILTDSPTQLNTTLGSVEAPSGICAFVLDLEVSQAWVEEPLTIEEAIVQVNELREKEREAFEFSITDLTREVFDAE